MKDSIEAIVNFLKLVAGKGDMASVQINNEGKVILRVGVTQERFLTTDQFLALLEEEA